MRRVTVSDHPKFVGSHLAEDGALFTAEIPSVGTTTAASAHARNEEIFREALAKHAPELASVPIADAFSAIRTALLQWMAESTLVGDELLAEYVLMWLMARIYRRNVDLTLGNLSMTITRCLSVTVDDVPPSSTQRPACSNAFAQSIFELVHALVPKALLLPLSVEMLNKHTLVPKAAQESSPSGDVEDFGGVDYAQGVLDAGLLQLTRGTFLVLDETSLASGQLQQRGIQNLSALRSVLTHHSLDYQLQGQPISFEKELHVMVLSEGESAMSANVRTPAQEPGQAPATVKASLLPTDITVPLAAKSSFDKSRSSSLESSHPWLPLFRLYVSYFRGAGSPSNDYTIPDAMAKLIEREFSEQRKAASADPAMRLMSDVDLLQLLGLARLLALSMGRSLLDEEVWERVKTLEKERELRINSPPATSQPGH